MRWISDFRFLNDIGFIWLLFLVSAILIAVVREKYQKKGIGIILNFATIILPIIVGTIMILTDFNSLLQ